MLVNETGSSSQNIAANIWLWVLALVCAVVFIIIDLLARKKYKAENVFNDQDIDGFKKVFKRDLISLIVDLVFLAIPYIVFIIFNNIDRSSSINQWFWVYFVVIGLVFNLIRKDPILYFLLSLKTFSQYVETKEYVDGTKEVRQGSGAKLFVCIILFILKVLLIIVYGFLVAAANMILSIIFYPIMETVLMVKTHKAIKSVADESSYSVNEVEEASTDLDSIDENEDVSEEQSAYEVEDVSEEQNVESNEGTAENINVEENSK